MAMNETLIPASWNSENARDNGDFLNFGTRGSPTRSNQRGTIRKAQMQEIEQIEKQSTMDEAHVLHLLREKEFEIQSLIGDLNVYNSQRSETQDALSEAKTIIDQQQEQISELLRRTALIEVDAETARLQRMFLKSPSNKRDTLPQQNEGLEGEIDELKYQLNEARKSQIRIHNENEFLKRQLQDSEARQFDVRSPNSLRDTQEFQKVSVAEVKQQQEASRWQIVQQEKKHQEEILRYENEFDHLRAELDSMRTREDKLSRNRQQLLEQNAELEDKFKRLTNRTELSSRGSHRNSPADTELSFSQLSDADTDLSAGLRRVTEERNGWKLYATSLVRSFVDNCDEFVQKTSYDEPEFATLAERRWYDYAMHLLEILMSVAPSQLAEMDLHLLKRSKDARRPQSDAMPPGENGPKFLHAVDVLKPKEIRITTSEKIAKLASKPLFRQTLGR